MRFNHFCTFFVSPNSKNIFPPTKKMRNYFILNIFRVAPSLTVHFKKKVRYIRS